MQLIISPKPVQALYPTDILFQTTFWGNVKSRLGWEATAFELSTDRTQGDVLVLTQHINDRTSIVYVPQGPEMAPSHEEYGRFLEELSGSLGKYLATTAAFIRYDLPWSDPGIVSLNSKIRKAGDFLRPRLELREIQMNCSTDLWNLRKSPFDLTVADSWVIDLTKDEDALLAEMKPKTRYNIRLSQRFGVTVRKADVSSLPIFYDLYLQTADRHGFSPCGYHCFSTLFDRDNNVETVTSPTLHFYLAQRDGQALSGAIISVSQKTAAYLFGASTRDSKNQMSAYALHWHIIRDARSLRCTTYDMGAVTPSKLPTHPFYGMYRFKTGFGGRIVHRVGSWDYPLIRDRYEQIRNAELLRLREERK